MSSLLLRNIALCTILVGVALIIVGALLGFKLLPENETIDKNVLLENSNQYNRWKELPFPLIFKVYIFNIKNTKQVLLGDIPELEEKGPYIYKKKILKEDIRFLEEQQDYVYKEKSSFEFDTEASLPYTLNDSITILNVAKYGILRMAEEQGNLWNLATKANLMFEDTKNSLFHKISVKDYLFGGYKFCTSKYVSDVCNNVGKQLKKTPIMTVNNDGSIIFSLLDYKITPDGFYYVHSGLENWADLGQIKQYKIKEYLDVWMGNTSLCNKVQGTDGLIYPPFIDKESTLSIFDSNICRLIPLQFSKGIEYKKLTLFRNVMKTSTYASENNFAENKCYCYQNNIGTLFNEKCLPDGYLDLRKCQNFPLVSSFPHFLYADQVYKNTVIGLSDNAEKHRTFYDIHPENGIPLRGAKRYQLNMMLKAMKELPFTKYLQPAALPIMWIEEALEYPEDVLNQLKNVYFSTSALVECVKWGLIAFGILLILIGVIVIILTFAKKKKKSKN